MLRNGLFQLRMREFSLTSESLRRGFTGSKTAFYSSLGHQNWKKKRSSKNRFQVTPVDTVVELRAGSRNFSSKMIGKHDDRPEASLPMTRLPQTYFNWNSNIEDEHSVALLEAESKRSPCTILRDEPWERPIYKYKEGSRRTGLIMKKLGVECMWWKNGQKLAATIYQVQNCHVVKYLPRHLHNGRDACLIVGAGLGNPFLKNENFIDYCLDAGLSPKAKMARFPITENAALEPGTELKVQHFHVGQHVDIVQRSVDHGRVDIVTRFHKKSVGGKHYRGRQPGALAGTGRYRTSSEGNWYNELSGRPLKGRRMPGQLGGCDTPAWGRRILRMNTKFQLIWVLGRTPGHIGDYARVYDTRTKKDIDAFKAEPPMFPTYYPELHGNEWTDEIWDTEVHCFDDPSITF